MVELYYFTQRVSRHCTSGLNSCVHQHESLEIPVLSTAAVRDIVVCPNVSPQLHLHLFSFISVLKVIDDNQCPHGDWGLVVVVESTLWL